jgi:hypothetical protein
MRKSGTEISVGSYLTILYADDKGTRASNRNALVNIRRFFKVVLLYVPDSKPASVLNSCTNPC